MKRFPQNRSIPGRHIPKQALNEVATQQEKRTGSYAPSENYLTLSSGSKSFAHFGYF